MPDLRSNGQFLKAAIDREIRQIELNIVALVELTHRLIPMLQSQPERYILNIAIDSRFSTRIHLWQFIMPPKPLSCIFLKLYL